MTACCFRQQRSCTAFVCCWVVKKHEVVWPCCHFSNCCRERTSPCYHCAPSSITWGESCYDSALQFSASLYSARLFSSLSSAFSPFHCSCHFTAYCYRLKHSHSLHSASVTSHLSPLLYFVGLSCHCYCSAWSLSVLTYSGHWHAWSTRSCVDYSPVRLVIIAVWAMGFCVFELMLACQFLYLLSPLLSIPLLSWCLITLYLSQHYHYHASAVICYWQSQCSPSAHCAACLFWSNVVTLLCLTLHDVISSPCHDAVLYSQRTTHYARLV